MITLTIITLVLALYLYNWKGRKRPKKHAIFETIAVLLCSPIILGRLGIYIIRKIYAYTSKYIESVKPSPDLNESH